jgi:hypothetical protein
MRVGSLIHDVGRHRRLPPVPARKLAQAAHNTWATARASIVFPSDEKRPRGNGAAEKRAKSLRPASETFQQMVM